MQCQNANECGSSFSRIGTCCIDIYFTFIYERIIFYINKNLQNLHFFLFITKIICFIQQVRLIRRFQILERPDSVASNHVDGAARKTKKNCAILWFDELFFWDLKKKSCIMLWYPPKSKLVYNDPREEKTKQIQNVFDPTANVWILSL